MKHIPEPGAAAAAAAHLDGSRDASRRFVMSAVPRNSRSAWGARTDSGMTYAAPQASYGPGASGLFAGLAGGSGSHACECHSKACCGCRGSGKDVEALEDTVRKLRQALTATREMHVSGRPMPAGRAGGRPGVQREQSPRHGAAAWSGWLVSPAAASGPGPTQPGPCSWPPCTQPASQQARRGTGLGAHTDGDSKVPPPPLDLTHMANGRTGPEPARALTHHGAHLAPHLPHASPSHLPPACPSPLASCSACP
jgi:hypothetical protein